MPGRPAGAAHHWAEALEPHRTIGGDGGAGGNDGRLPSTEALLRQTLCSLHTGPLYSFNSPAKHLALLIYPFYR